jgi:tRNA threonylcarbamoyl adenosine modification protein (Sua5/YciO/YrdC/YwlC family)
VSREGSPVAIRLAASFWPGPITLVVPGHPSLPANLSQDRTIGVRMPDHEIALALLRKTGPLAVTSANLSGRENTTSTQQVLDQLDGKVHLVLDGGNTPGGIPSTVVSCIDEQLVILREGPIKLEQIKETLEY